MTKREAEEKIKAIQLKSDIEVSKILNGPETPRKYVTFFRNDLEMKCWAVTSREQFEIRCVEEELRKNETVAFNVSIQGESIVQSAKVRRSAPGVMVVEIITAAGVEAIHGASASGVPFVSFCNSLGLRSDSTVIEFPELNGWSVAGLGNYVESGARRNHSNPYSFSITLVGPK